MQSKRAKFKEVSCSLFKSLDLFGEKINLTFKQEKDFKTTFGAIISLICSIALIAFLVVQTQKLISKEDPFFSMTTSSKVTDTIDLWELGFIFAIENIDPKVGRIEAVQNFAD